MQKLVLHLISDSTGETATAVARAASGRFSKLKVVEYQWPLVRSEVELKKVFVDVKKQPGIIIYTISDFSLRKMLRQMAAALDLPCLSAIGNMVIEIANYLGMEAPAIDPRHRLELNEEYFEKIETFNFTIQHDDGQMQHNAHEADIVLLGASRTSKSPTAFYLAHRGYKVANIPFVMGTEPAANLAQIKKSGAMIVGLTISPLRLQELRQERAKNLYLTKITQNNYTDIATIKQEVRASMSYFLANGLKVIDVTHKSVEETSAEIIKMYNEYTRNE